MEKLTQIEQVLQIGAKLLQIEAAPLVINRGNSYYKSWRNYYKLGQLLQTGVELLQIRAIITNWCITVGTILLAMIFEN